MMNLPRLRSLLLLILAISLLGGFGYVIARTGPLAAVRVTIASPEYRDLEPAIFGIGTVEARRTYIMGPVAAGRVKTVQVDVGDEVTVGQPVADIDPVDLDDRVAAARAALQRTDYALAAAEALIREAASRQALAEANTQRFIELRRQGYVTQEAADARQHDANSARTLLTAAQANRDAAGQDRERLLAELAAIEKQRANLRLLSPIAGIVASRDAEPGSTLVAGQSIVHLIDPASIWLRVRIDQARSAGLRVGLPAAIVLRSRPGERLPGQVARVEWLGDSVTEEKIAQVAFAELPEGVALGELAEVTLQLPPVPDALTLPNAAVRYLAGQSGVWLITAQDTVRFQPLRFGIRTPEGLAQLLDPLPPAARVILYSERDLKAGETVDIRAALTGGIR